MHVFRGHHSVSHHLRRADLAQVMRVLTRTRSPYVLHVHNQGDRAYAEAERVLLDDVREAIEDLVEVIQTYKAKNKFSKVLMSTLFKRRQEEAEAVIAMAISRLQVSTP